MTEAIPRCGGWAAQARPDPCTGLVSFPDFHAEFPGHLANAADRKATIGLAIGDVDRLTGYGGSLDTVNPERFGHLAGNAIMTRLGLVSATWFREQKFRAGCVSTFGGDELIVAAEVRDPDTFELSIVTLRDRFSRELPRTVSFALTIISPDTPVLQLSPSRATYAADLALATVDMMLFNRKESRTSAADDGFVETFLFGRVAAHYGEHSRHEP
jgi:GGDEF domain-containing protein